MAIYKTKVFLNWSLSADGSQLALVLTNSEPKVTFMSVNDKSTREVKLKGYSHVNTVDWPADSKSVYVVAQTTSGTDAIVEVEPLGNQRVLPEADEYTLFWWAIQSPDQRHVIIEQLTGENNVWSEITIGVVRPLDAWLWPTMKITAWSRWLGVMAKP